MKNLLYIFVFLTISCKPDENSLEYYLETHAIPQLGTLVDTLNYLHDKKAPIHNGLIKQLFTSISEREIIERRREAPMYGGGHMRFYWRDYEQLITTSENNETDCFVYGFFDNHTIEISEVGIGGYKKKDRAYVYAPKKVAIVLTAKRDYAFGAAVHDLRVIGAYDLSSGKEIKKESINRCGVPYAPTKYCEYYANRFPTFILHLLEVRRYFPLSCLKYFDLRKTPDYYCIPCLTP